MDREGTLDISDTVDSTVVGGLVERLSNLGFIGETEQEYDKLIISVPREKLTDLGLSNFTNPQMSRVVQTLIYTGMRVGKLTALHWDEVDLDRARITVKYNLYRLNGEYVLDTPKTKSSARMIALPPQLVELLREQKQWQENRKLEVADRWIDRNAVFTGQYGEYMNKTYINTKFKELLKKHNFPDVHIHDLRHAYVKLLLKYFTTFFVIFALKGISRQKYTVWG